MHVESVFLRDGRWIFYIKRVEIYIYIYVWLLTKKQPLTQNAENLFFFWGQVEKPELEKQIRFLKLCYIKKQFQLMFALFFHITDVENHGHPHFFGVRRFQPG